MNPRTIAILAVIGFVLYKMTNANTAAPSMTGGGSSGSVGLDNFRFNPVDSGGVLFTDAGTPAPSPTPSANPAPTPASEPAPILTGVGRRPSPSIGTIDTGFSIMPVIGL